MQIYAAYFSVSPACQRAMRELSVVFYEVKTLASVERELAVGRDERQPHCDGLCDDEVVGRVVVSLRLVDVDFGHCSHNLHVHLKDTNIEVPGDAVYHR